MSAIQTAAEAAYDAAIEISADDPLLLKADFESFCDVMWQDDIERNELGLSPEDYRLALQYAWEKLPR